MVIRKCHNLFLRVLFFFLFSFFVIPIMDFQLWIDELRFSTFVFHFSFLIYLYVLYFVWVGVVIFSFSAMDFLLTFRAITLGVFVVQQTNLGK